MELLSARIEKPEAINFILGQTHFIKTVEDLHEALVGAVPGIRFGLAFCEASGKWLVRWSGTDPAMIELAKSNALAIGASSLLAKPSTRPRNLPLSFEVMLHIEGATRQYQPHSRHRTKGRPEPDYHHRIFSGILISAALNPLRWEL